MSAYICYILRLFRTTIFDLNTLSVTLVTYLIIPKMALICYMTCNAFSKKVF